MPGTPTPDLTPADRDELLAAVEAALLAPLTFDAFQTAWTDACGKAWDADFGEPALLLPGFLWPHLTELVNPVTGASVPIQRTDAFPVTAPAAGGLADIG